VNDERSPEAGLWDEDDDHADDEQTQVARNPLLVGPPASTGGPTPAAGSGRASAAGVTDPSAATSPAIVVPELPPADGDSARRSVSSFGMPKVGKKSSLLDRLTESGALEEVMAIDEVSRQSVLPNPPDSRGASDRTLGLDRPFADLAEVSSGVPHAVLESLVPPALERDEARLSPLPVARRERGSTPPPALTEMQPTPVARVPTIRRVLEPVREITNVRDPRREPDDDELSARPSGERLSDADLMRASEVPGRPSAERISDADLQFVSESRPTSEVSFVSALSQDPDADEPPVVARFKRPPELPRNQPSLPPASMGSAAPDSLTPPATPIGLGAAPLPPPLPSMMVSSGTPTIARGDTTPTERMPLPRPANHSTAPTSAPKTERPPEKRSSGPWLLVAAAVLLGIGLAGLSRYRNAESQADPVAASAPSAATPIVEAEPVKVAALEAAKPEAVAPVAEPTSAKPAPEQSSV
jgi:hypothetical protein